MLCAAKFHLSFDSAIKAKNNHSFSSVVRRQRFDLRLPARHLPSLSVRSVSPSAASDPSDSLPSSECYTSSVGFSPSLPLSQWNLTQRHNLALNVTVSLAAVSATCLFLSAIPALLAFKRAAESLEKLMDVTREELPGTMAAIRLSGMEISDLTMELSDFGQDITQGVRSSTRAVRVAEERLRQLTNMAPSGNTESEN
ncbi:uncharacterized protein LOC119984079 isoform X2 [Tripterygium wilfordii]|uniref:uncharacterized protein LOC119984079 isoform X2 n=1 Tax=Tripterygium wilfordii TaxID=458696 RepID=UPI0018F814FB|nr:uncharacterized protein LOC119984079 isoform X2 [Tripterygium wilfordii]